MAAIDADAHVIETTATFAYLSEAEREHLPGKKRFLFERQHQQFTGKDILRPRQIGDDFSLRLSGVLIFHGLFHSGMCLIVHRESMVEGRRFTRGDHGLRNTGNRTATAWEYCGVSRAASLGADAWAA